jgi:serine/threonine-protein kinase HipA
MAPLYDAAARRVFPKLKHDHLALKLNGKDENLRRADFRALAATAGLRAADADAAIDDMVKSLGDAVETIALPKAVEFTEEATKIVAEVLDICRARTAGYGG